VRTIVASIRKLIPVGTPLVVAFSGGADSLALLCALSGRKSPVWPVYVNHHIRTEMELQAEIALNQKNCRTLGFTLVVKDVDPKRLAGDAKRVGTEQAARSQRYELLLSFAKEHNAVLVTAHTADDQLETMVMRLCQGSPCHRLAIAPRVVMDGVTVLHPLLSFSHLQLCALLEEQSFSWSEDSTNANDAYLRNRVRHQIIPTLKSVFPQALDAVARTAESGGELSRYLDNLASMVSVSPLSRSAFLACPPPARDGVILRLLDADRRVRSAGVKRIREAVEKGGDWRIRANGKVIRCSGDLVIAEPERKEQGFVLSVNGLKPGDVVPLDDQLELRVLSDGPEVDPLLLRLPVALLSHAVLRSQLSGDVLDAVDGPVRIRDLASDWKVSPSRRFRIPVLEGGTGVLAVFGRWCGGHDRLSVSCKSLAPRDAIVYSIGERKPV